MLSCKSPSYRVNIWGEIKPSIHFYSLSTSVSISDVLQSEECLVERLRATAVDYIWPFYPYAPDQSVFTMHFLNVITASNQRPTTASKHLFLSTHISYWAHTVDIKFYSNSALLILCVITVAFVCSACVCVCWRCRYKGLWSSTRDGLHPRRLLHGGHWEHDGRQRARQLWERCRRNAQLQNWDIRWWRRPCVVTFDVVSSPGLIWGG